MELWRGLAGSGKTGAVVALVADTVRQQPLARVWVVLPTSRLRALFRERLLNHLREQNLPAFNVELFNFYTLNRRLLNLLREPVRSLRGGARQAVLRRVAARASLSTFAAVADKSGFAHAVGELIGELKQAGVQPETFTEAAIKRGTARDRDLAHLYAAYQELLRDHHMVDTEGEAWLTLARVRQADDWTPQVTLLAVDGFDQFTPMQADLIRALDERVARTVVTLTHVPRREEGIGRRFERARASLGSVGEMMIAGHPHPAAAVRHLLDHSFDMQGHAPACAPEDAPAIHLIEAHSPSAEAVEVMRRIKRRLVLDRAAPESVMVIVRDWARYEPALSSAAVQYGVPVALQAGAPLMRHPLAALLRDLLALRESQFSSSAVLDVLRSPYVRFDELDRPLLDKLEAVIRRSNLVRGIEVWETALSDAQHHRPDDFGHEQPPLIDAQEAQRLMDVLQRLFDLFPQDGDRDSVWNFVQRVDFMLGADPDHDGDADAPVDPNCLHICAQVRESSEPSGDVPALRAIKEALRDLLLTEDLLAALTEGDARTVTWRDFTADLLAALEAAEIHPSPDRSGRVLVTTITDARGSAHDHVFILGLSEGIFPAPLPDDPLFLESERARLTYAGERLLRAATERHDEDSVFYELLALARSSLTLSRPSINNGQPWPASPLWNAVVALLPEGYARGSGLVRITPGRPPALDTCASFPELSAAVHASGVTPPAYADFLARHDALRSAHVTHTRQVETVRMAAARGGSAGEYAAYIGLFTSPDLLGLTASIRAEDYRWSASRINALGSCAYRVFAERVLGLNDIDEPEEGVDAKMQGTLMHRILEETYRRFARDRLEISADNQQAALDTLRRTAAQVLTDAPLEYAFTPNAIWAQQKTVITRTLHDFVRRDFSAESPVAGFGSGRRFTLAVEAQIGLDDDVQWLSVPYGEDDALHFRFGGKIDRIDAIETVLGYDLVVIDYKLSSSPISPADVLEGRHTQIVLYLSALDAVIRDPKHAKHGPWFGQHPGGKRAVGGLFWSMRSGLPLNVLHVEQPMTRGGLTGQEVIDQSMQSIAERIAQVRTGDFRPLPPKPTQNGQCHEHCPFVDLCRMCELA